jgi:membrane-bound lytic murein transglycosylase B
MTLRARARQIAAAVAIALVCANPLPAAAQDPVVEGVPGPDAATRFRIFLQEFRAEAIKAGIEGGLYDRATSGITLNPRVEQLNLSQPEFVRPVWDYLEGVITDTRVNRGRDLIVSNADMFARLQAAYGVPSEVLAAIWGIETNYGQNLGSFNLFEALATLAYEGPRAAYGRRQLIAALKIAQAEERDPATMTGSWAGAFGFTQFVPTTFLERAVDGDGDGKRDLWNSTADALASTANYLQRSGWRSGETWGEEVLLPTDFAYENADPEIRLPNYEWARMGVREINGEPIPESADSTAIFLPAGASGPAFMLRDNFYAILRYNFATSYALAVSVLSDRLRGASGITGSWPRGEAMLTFDQRMTLQEGLTTLGFDTGGRDGVLGRLSRQAIREYQKSRGLPADGYATPTLLTRILNERFSIR